MKRKPKPKVESPTTPAPAQGGLGGSLALDPSKPSDRRLIRLAMRQGWNVSAEAKAEIVEKTLQALRDAAEKKNARDVAGCARVLVAADAADQKDVHEQEKYDRIDEGKATDAVMLIDDLKEGE